MKLEHARRAVSFGGIFYWSDSGSWGMQTVWRWLNPGKDDELTEQNTRNAWPFQWLFMKPPTNKNYCLCSLFRWCQKYFCLYFLFYQILHWNMWESCHRIKSTSFKSEIKNVFRCKNLNYPVVFLWGYWSDEAHGSLGKKIKFISCKRITLTWLLSHPGSENSKWLKRRFK